MITTTNEVFGKESLLFIHSFVHSSSHFVHKLTLYIAEVNGRMEINMSRTIEILFSYLPDQIDEAAGQSSYLP